MNFGTDGAMRALEERRNHNTRQVERLMDLCKVLAQRITETTNGQEIDDMRGEIARYRHDITGYEAENGDISGELRELKSRSGQ